MDSPATERTSMTLAAGPRLHTRDRMAADLSGRFMRAEIGVISLMPYQRTQTTVIGIARPVDVENCDGPSGAGGPERSQARVTPGFLRSRAGGLRTDVYRWGLASIARSARCCHSTSAYEANVQTGRLQHIFRGGGSAGTPHRFASSRRLQAKRPF